MPRLDFLVLTVVAEKQNLAHEKYLKKIFFKMVFFSLVQLFRPEFNFISNTVKPNVSRRDFVYFGFTGLTVKCRLYHVMWFRSAVIYAKRVYIS